MKPDSKPRKATSRKTKAQLIEELESVNEELASVQLLLDEKEGDLEALRQEHATATAQRAEAVEKIDGLEESLANGVAETDRLRQEIDRVKNDLVTKATAAQDAAKENARLLTKIESLTAQVESSDLEMLEQEVKEVQKAQKGAEKKLVDLEQENESLKKALADAEQQQRTTVSKISDGVEAIPTSKATFRLYLFPGEGAYPGIIEHLPTNRSVNFQRLDREFIFDFITSHLPREATEKTLSARESVAEFETSMEEARAPGSDTTMEVEPAPEKIQSVVPTTTRRSGLPRARNRKVNKATSRRVLGEIQIQQFERPVISGHPLTAYAPFRIQTHMCFPETPTERNMPFDMSDYGIRILTRSKPDREIIDRNDVADSLIEGVADYIKSIDLPAMQPGEYVLTIGAYAPYASISDSRDIELVVR